MIWLGLVLDLPFWGLTIPALWLHVLFFLFFWLFDPNFGGFLGYIHRICAATPPLLFITVSTQPSTVLLGDLVIFSCETPISLQLQPLVKPCGLVVHLVPRGCLGSYHPASLHRLFVPCQATSGKSTLSILIFPCISCIWSCMCSRPWYRFFRYVSVDGSKLCAPMSQNMEGNCGR